MIIPSTELLLLFMALEGEINKFFSESFLVFVFTTTESRTISDLGDNIIGLGLWSDFISASILFSSIRCCVHDKKVDSSHQLVIQHHTTTVTDIKHGRGEYMSFLVRSNVSRRLSKIWGWWLCLVEKEGHKSCSFRACC